MRDRLIELLEDCGRSQMPMVAGLEFWADAIADYLIENNSDENGLKTQVKNLLSILIR